MGYEVNEKIMALIKARGPILPVTAGKAVGCDIIIASAYLATMVSRHELKLTHLKVGGSPLYYIPGQESMLEGYADRLNPQDRRAYELLKDKKVVRDIELSTLERVSFRNLKDFAIGLNVKHEDRIEIFWKWYSLSDQEAEEGIKKLLHIEEPAPERVKAEPEKPAVAAKAEEPRPGAPIRAEGAPQPASLEAIGKEPKKKPSAPRKKREPAAEKSKQQEKLIVEYAEPEPPKEEPAPPVLQDHFLDEVKGYFSQNGIELLESAIVKKEMELDLVISLPSPVGKLTYYCKAKNKKKSNEADLAYAFVQGQLRKLPTLYLTKGEVTKKAAEMLARDFKGMTLKIF